MPTVEAIGFGWAADVQTVDSPVQVKRFVAQWKRWRRRGATPDRRRKAKPVRMAGIAEPAWVDAHNQITVWLPRAAPGTQDEFGRMVNATALRSVDFTDVG